MEEIPFLGRVVLELFDGVEINVVAVDKSFQLGWVGSTWVGVDRYGFEFNVTGEGNEDEKLGIGVGFDILGFPKSFVLNSVRDANLETKKGHLPWSFQISDPKA
jgi:hypothetical protein